MIEITKLNNVKIMVNPYLIETIEETPDTVIVFNSGRKIVVKDKAKDIRSRFGHFMASAIKVGLEKSKGV